jgi:hypothetical protein
VSRVCSVDYHYQIYSYLEEASGSCWDNSASPSGRHSVPANITAALPSAWQWERWKASSWDY